MDQKENGFNYTYSSKQAEEIKNIQQKYMPQQENKMEQLRKLDQSATRPGTIASLLIGVMGMLMLGIGMVCTMVWTAFFIPGIFIGIIGIAGIALAYPAYRMITKKQREKLAPIIMQLSEELLNQ